MSSSAQPPAAAAPLLTVPDPQGDARGDGSYVLPGALVKGMERSLDLREFRAEDRGGRLRLVLAFGGVDNPWSAPRGFSVPLIDVFVKTDLGGAQTLGDTRLNAPPGDGWQRHYQVSGFRTLAWVADKDGQVRESPARPDVGVSGSEVVLDTDLPAKRYGYWVTVRLYSPLSGTGFLSPVVGGGDAALVAGRPGLPSPVDVLLAGPQERVYLDRVLPPSGELRDRRPAILLALGGAALLVALLATFRAWRRV